MASRDLVLGVLLRGPAHGYLVRRRIEDLPGLARPAESSRVYALLRALERDGLVAASEEPLRSGRRRRVYALRAAGRDAALRWLARPVRASAAARRPLVLRLAAGEEGGPALGRALREAEAALRRRSARAAAAARERSAVERALLARRARRFALEADALARWIGAGREPAVSRRRPAPAPR